MRMDMRRCSRMTLRKMGMRKCSLMRMGMRRCSLMTL